jgi:hypothetical protein
MYGEDVLRQKLSYEALPDLPLLDAPAPSSHRKKAARGIKIFRLRRMDGIEPLATPFLMARVPHPAIRAAS